MCLRCSPGLFRHSCGAVSCHTSSMAANPHLALTKNSSPTTLAKLCGTIANGWRAAQIAESRGSAPGRASQGAKHPPAAAGETPQSSQRAIRRWRNPRSVCRKAAVPTPSRVVDGGLLGGTGYRYPAHGGTIVTTCNGLRPMTGIIVDFRRWMRYNTQLRMKQEVMLCSIC